MVIYTRIGDLGETGLLGGKRLCKSDLIFDVLGSVDELNSNIGLVVGMMESVLNCQLLVIGGQKKRIEDGLASLIGQLRNVQRKLFGMGSILAKNDEILKIKKFEIFETHRLAEEFVQGKENVDEKQKMSFDIDCLERLIDEMEEDLPRLKKFILPGGGVMGAQLMVVRAVCRRAERDMVRYLKLKLRKQKNSKESIGFLPEQGVTKPELENKKILQYMNRLSDYFFVMSRWVNWLMKEDENVWK